jgi:hypothetical protein
LNEKLQTPNSNIQGISNPQAIKPERAKFFRGLILGFSWRLEFEVWDFPGVWMLRLEVFP